MPFNILRYLDDIYVLQVF